MTNLKEVSLSNLVFEARSRFHAPASEVFAWHEAKGAFDRLSPPWVDVQCVERSGGIADGSRVVLLIKQGPVSIPWVLGHKDYIAGEQFCDYQIAGPFRFWQQLHKVRNLETGGDFIADGAKDGTGELSELLDRVEFCPPLGLPGKIGGALYIKSELKRLFRYRHALLARDLALKDRYGDKPLKILISGATGLVGRHLKALLETQGHQVITLARGASAGAASADDAILWDPSREEIARPLPEDLDAVVHLCGHNVAASRWTLQEKQLIFESRVKSTTYLSKLLAGLKKPPAAVVFASAVGFYGDRGVEPLTEDAACGSGFLAEVCRSWEQSGSLAEKSGARVSYARIGAVLSPRGGALAKLLPVFQSGGGGPVGSGQQYFPWVALEDVSAAIYHAIQEPTLSGPFNLVSPECVTNAQFSRSLGRVLHRPALLPVQPALLKAIYGEMAEALMLASLRVLPQKLKQTGYQFQDPDLEPALKFMLGLA